MVGAAAGLGQADGFLDGALLVRADRERQEAVVDRAAVAGQRHPAAGGRDALHADQDVHARVPVTSAGMPGGGTAPTARTVAG